MANQPEKVTKRVWIGSALGAVVGIVIGGLIGHSLVTSLLRGVEWADPLRIAYLLGLAMAGIIGGVGGSRLGTWLVNSRSGVPIESVDAELARLKERVAELEEQKRNNGTSE